MRTIWRGWSTRHRDRPLEKFIVLTESNGADGAYWALQHLYLMRAANDYEGS